MNFGPTDTMYPSNLKIQIMEKH